MGYSIIPCFVLNVTFDFIQQIVVFQDTLAKLNVYPRRVFENFGEDRSVSDYSALFDSTDREIITRLVKEVLGMVY